MSGMRQMPPFVRFGINDGRLEVRDVAVHVIRPLAGFGLTWYKTAPTETCSRQVPFPRPSRVPMRDRSSGQLPSEARSETRENERQEVT